MRGRKVALAAALVLLGATGGYLSAQSALFEDVPSDHYAHDAVEWAVKRGITYGCAPGKFCPDAPLTRGQAVTFLYRYDRSLSGEDSTPLPIPGSSEGPMPPVTTTQVGGQSYYSPNTAITPADSLRVLRGIQVGPERCAGYDPNSYAVLTGYLSLGSVGYLTHDVVAVPQDDLVPDYVVDLKEAWCSGVGPGAFERDTYNLWPARPAVDSGKGAFDPREWWDSDSPTSPRIVDYPGWCEYLNIHVKIKDDWEASMDQAEYDFVRSQLRQCSN